MKFEAPAWVSFAVLCASILLAIMSKLWDPIPARVGSPFGVQRLVNQLGEKVKELRNKRASLHNSDPFPSDPQRIGWVESVDDLVKKEKEIKNSLDNHSLTYWKRCNIGRDIEEEIEKANDLDRQGNKIVPEIKRRFTRRGNRSRPEVEESSSPAQLEELHPLPGMESPYNKVLNFIKDNRPESVIMGVWGMGGVGKTTLINLVRDSRPVYHDYFQEVVLVQAGKGGTEVVDLQKAMAVSMGLDEISNEISQADIIRMHLESLDFLLMLDGLWEDIDLEKVGIPSLEPWADVLQPHYYRR